MDIHGTRRDDRLVGTSRDDDLHGRAGADTLIGRGGDDRLYGGADADVLLGGCGADALDGGSGVDTALFAEAREAVVIDLADPARNAGEAAGDAFVSIENIFGSAFDDVIRSNGARTLVFGAAGNDTLVGLAGVTFMLGGPGADRMVGRGERDSAAYWDSPTGLTVDLAHPGRNTGIAAGDSYHRIGELEGSDFDDRLSATEAANTIFAFAGDDRLYGRGGADWLNGGPGADLLNGGDGEDRAAYWDAAAGVTADLDDPARNAGEATGDLYRSVEGLEGARHGDALFGDAGDNRLFGGAGEDRLHGRAGDDDLYGDADRDRLDGDAGGDFLHGGAGADALDGGPGHDRAAYWNAAAGVTADLAQPRRGAGEGAGDAFRSIEGLDGSALGDVLSGDAGANSLFGGAGADELRGRGGADDLYGGIRQDRLSGGDGADDFVFTAPPRARDADELADFEPGLDRILLHASAFPGLDPGALAATAFVTGERAGAEDDRLLHDRTTGALAYDPDGDGAAQAVLVARLERALALEAGDLLVLSG